MADDRHFHGRRRPAKPLSKSSTRQTSTPRSPALTNYSRRRRDWKTRQAKWSDRFFDVLRGPRLGTRWPRYWPTTFSSRSPSRVVNAGLWRRPRCRHREACEPWPRLWRTQRQPLLRSAGNASPLLACVTRTAIPGTAEFVAEQLILAEIDADNRIVAQIVIDPDDIDAAIEELDARYLAGEAAAHAHTWSVIAGLRRVQPARTSSRRRLGDRRPPASYPRSSPATMTADLRAMWDVTPNLNIQIEAVHRLRQFRRGRHPYGIMGPRTEGFDAEWRLDPTSDCRGRPNQPMRTLRRSRPRRRARPL